jgi:hypothetical protein
MFRQENAGDWNPVIAQIASKLARMAGADALRN